MANASITSAKVKTDLGSIHEALLEIRIQREVVDKYTLSHAVDETLALLGGDSSSSTYLGYSVERGPSLLQYLAGLESRLKAIIKLVGN